MAEFKNPNQEPGMERRLLLVFGLTFLLLLLLQPLLMKYIKKPEAERQPQANAAAESVATATPAARATETGKEGGIPAAGVKQAAGESEIVVENDLYRIAFTNKGAQA